MADIRQETLINGLTAGINDLDDVDMVTTPPVITNILAYDGADWVPSAAPAGTAADEVSVNSSAATDADFDDTTPAAPAGGVNVKFQISGASPSSISAHLAAGDVSNALIRDSAALSVLGRSANSSGDIDDIAGTDTQVLRVSGTTLGFGTIATGGLADNSVNYAKLQDVAGFSVVGKSTTGSGDAAAITAGTNSLLGRVAGDLAFAQVATAQVANNAISYAKWQQLAGFSIAAKTDTGTGDAADLTAGTNTVLSRAAGDLVFAQIITAQLTDANVTYGKIQDALASSKLLGSGATGIGNPLEEITLGTGLSMAGSTLNATASATGDSGYILVDDEEDHGGANFVVADHINRTVEGDTRGNNAVDLSTFRGNDNQVAAADQSVIAGGRNNRIQIAGTGGFIGAGLTNHIQNGFQSVIAGGINNLVNMISGEYGVIGGGNANEVSGTSGTISGGVFNSVTGSTAGTGATVGGGATNDVLSSLYGTIAGGRTGVITSSDYATISGGFNNSVDKDYGVVPGGLFSTSRRFGEMAYGGRTQVYAQKSSNIATVLTSDATQTIMGYTSTFGTWASTLLDGATIPFPASGAYMMAFEGYVIGMQAEAGATEACCFKIEGAMKKDDGGTVAFVGTPKVSVVGRDNVNLDVDVVLAAADAGANIRVTGIAAEEWTWTCEWEGPEMLVPAL